MPGSCHAARCESQGQAKKDFLSDALFLGDEMVDEGQLPTSHWSATATNMDVDHDFTDPTSSSFLSSSPNPALVHIPAAPYQAVKFDGSSVLIPRRRRVPAWRAASSSAASSRAPALSEPLDVLMSRIRAANEEGREREASVTPAPPCRRAYPQDSRMWVEKYRPRAFTDLMGDDRLHRETLRWLKTWDPCVFGRDAPPPSARSARGNEPSTTTDQHGRPHERVLLMSGPPGLGKTTLAHVVAQHAGYRVHEMNASDARTAGDVHNRVRSALESDSLQGHGRPTLVVIDEIDGAMGGNEALGTTGFVRALVQLIERGARSSHKTRPLLRPIVCICNDLYAPALRPLRPLARIVRFHRPPTPMITRRLREICARECLAADARGLTMLCDVSHGDIRACLHTLELLHRQGGSVHVDAIQRASLGMKDSVVPLQHIWTQLFRALDQPHSSLHGSRVHALVQELISYADYDRLARGCFEHYVHLRVPGQGWQRYESALDWLHFSQSLMHGAWSGTGQGSAFELLGFVPWAFVAWHMLFANVANPIPEYPPREDYERHLQLTATLELVDTLCGCLPASLAPFYSRRTVACELAPALVRILSPDLKVSTPVPTRETKAALDALVDTMLMLQLSFEPDRDEHGVVMYRIQPPIDVFGQYAGQASGLIGPSRHGAKQYVQRAIDAEQRRRRTAAALASSGATLQDTAAAATAASCEMLPPYPTPGATATYRDFFGRVISTPKVPQTPASTARASPSASSHGPRVFYRYHEGYSNAVRKPIKLAALL